MRSTLTLVKPASRAARTRRPVISALWMRSTDSCTTGSKSWMPIEIRRQPSRASVFTWSAVVTRGSASSASSAPGRNVKRSAISPCSRSSSDGEK